MAPLPAFARAAPRCRSPRDTAPRRPPPSEVRLLCALPRPDARDVSPDIRFVLFFNAAVPARDVLERARLVGPDLVPLVLGAPADIERLARKHPLVAVWPGSRRVVLRPTRPLKKSGRYALTIRAGIPGPPGVGPSARPFRRRFRTWAPLRVVSAGCLGPQPCRPELPLRLTFNNPLADPDPGRHLKVRPALPGLTCFAVGRHLLIFGRFRAASRVGLRVRASLRDVFGQPAPRYEVVVPLASEPPEARFARPPWATLAPQRAARVAVDVSGVAELRLRMLRVTRQNLVQVLSLMQRPPPGPDAPDPLENVDRVLVDRVLRLAPPHGQMQRQVLDPWIVLKGRRVGVVYLNLRSRALAGPRRQRPAFRHRIVQLTNIALGLHRQPALLDVIARDRRGRPLAALDLEVITATGFSRWLGRTDAKGRARIPRGRLQGPEPLYLVAVQGQDLAVQPLGDDPAPAARAPERPPFPDLGRFLTSLQASALGIIAHSLRRLSSARVTPSAARSPLTLAPDALPPRVTCGDRLELRPAVSNPTDRLQRFVVGIRATGIAVVGAPRRLLAVPPGRRDSVPFTIQALHPGVARIQIGAAGPTSTHGLERRLEVAPLPPAAPAPGRGILVLRRLLSLPGERPLRAGADRAIRIRLGARVRVWLALVLSRAMEHVVLWDFLPAGLQAVSPLSAGAAFTFQRLGPRGPGLTARRLPAGIHVVTYQARARHPGTFLAPAARAVSLTQPDAHGQSPLLRVRITGLQAARASGGRQ